MANCEADRISSTSGSGTGSFEKIFKRLIDADVFNCEVCGAFFKTAVFAVSGIGTVCQNCLGKNNNWQGIRLKFFDVALQDLPVVPCTNAGCQMQMLPENLKVHSTQDCKYRPVNCICPDCPWQDNPDELTKHFEEKHATEMISEGKSFSLDIANESFVAVKLLTKRSNKSKYFIVIRRESNSPRILYNAFRAEKGNVHKVAIKHFPSISAEEKDEDDPPLLTIERSIKTQDLNVIDKTWAWTANPVENFDNLIKFSRNKNELFLSVNVTESKTEELLRCSACNITMRSPIYVSVFEDVERNVCRKCNKFEKTRNVHLEAMTINVFYPCVYQEFGCEAKVAGVEQIEQHELKCAYKVDCCPLPGCTHKCKSSELFNEHLDSQHKTISKGNSHVFRHQVIHGPFNGINHQGSNYVYFDDCVFEIKLIIMSSDINTISQATCTLVLLSNNNKTYPCDISLGVVTQGATIKKKIFTVRLTAMYDKAASATFRDLKLDPLTKSSLAAPRVSFGSTPVSDAQSVGTQSHFELLVNINDKDLFLGVSTSNTTRDTIPIVLPGTINSGSTFNSSTPSLFSSNVKIGLN